MSVYRVPQWRMRTVFDALAQGFHWSVEMLGLPASWKITRGAYPGGRVKVLIIDTGVQINPQTERVDHPDLQGQLKMGRDFTGSPYKFGDVNGHGTATVSLLAAKNDDAGIVGVCSDAEIYVAKGLGDDGSGSNAGIAAAIRWGIELDVDIISFSGGSPQEDPEVTSAVNDFINGREQRFFVAAAGNDGASNTVQYPAALDNVLAVGAVDRNGVTTIFSSRGPQVDIAGPGQGVRACALRSKYGDFDGTSFACPLVAGVVALLLAKHRMPGTRRTPLNNLADLRGHLNAITVRTTDKDGNTYPIARADQMLAREDEPPTPAPVDGWTYAIGPFRWSMPARTGDLCSVGIQEDVPPDEKVRAAAVLSTMLKSMAEVADQRTM